MNKLMVFLSPFFLLISINLLASEQKITSEQSIEQLTEGQKNTIRVTRHAYTSKINSLKYGKTMSLKPVAFTESSLASKSLLRKFWEVPVSFTCDIVKLPLSLIASPLVVSICQDKRDYEGVLRILDEAKEFKEETRALSMGLSDFLVRVKKHPVFRDYSLEKIAALLNKMEKNGEFIETVVYNIDPETYKIPPYFPVYAAFKPLKEHELMRKMLIKRHEYEEQSEI